MTSFERGDVVLVSYPTNDALEMHLRPAMVVQDAHPHDFGIAVVPISPEPSDSYVTLHLPHASFEAARFGLLTPGYLIACEEVVVNRQFVLKKIGRCPWQMLNEFLGMLRQPFAGNTASRTVEAAQPKKNLIREAV